MKTDPTFNDLPSTIPYPWLYEPLHKLETLYDAHHMQQFFSDWYFVAPLTCFLYVVVVVWLLPRIMKNRKPFELRKPLAAWNLLLAVYSFVAFCRVAPAFYYYLTNGRMDYFLCASPTHTYLHGSLGFWISTFIYSKYFELVDTVFLALRKKPIGFLHWIHHLTVLWYCWDAAVSDQPIGIIFACMNLFVHSIMYTYYFLAAIGKPPRWGMPVTIMQITQMLIGCYVVFSQLYRLFIYGEAQIDRPSENAVSDFLNAYIFPLVGEKSDDLYIVPPGGDENTISYLKEHGCAAQSANVLFANGIYGLYLFLFCRFFALRYFFKGSNEVSPHRSHTPAVDKKRQ